MQCLTSGGALLILLTLVAWKANGACQRRLGYVEGGRACRRSCTSNAHCRAKNKKCLCDGACGLSCFNPNAECYPLEEILNGSRNVTKSTVGGEALYWCNDGFSLKGSRTRNCYADKRWHPEAPTCEHFCESIICLNDGTCVLNQSGYTCSCGYGFGGAHCEFETCQRSQCQNGGRCVPNESGYTCSCGYGFGGTHCENDTPGMLDLMILIPGDRYHRDTEKNAYKNWLKAFGNYVTSSHAYTLSVYQYGQKYYQNGWHNLLESKLLLNGISSSQFQLRIDSLNLNRQHSSPLLYPKTITSIGTTPWGGRKSPARKKILIILVERTIERYHTKRISDSVNCMEYEGISVYFIGATSFHFRGTTTFKTRLKAIIGSLNTERNFHMIDRQQLAQERSIQSLTEYIEKRRDSCVPPFIALGAGGITCRWKSSTENTFHPGDKLFFECKKSSPRWARYVENPWYALCKTDGTWVFVKKDRCERE